MYCRSCGSFIPDGYSQCPSCGTQISQTLYQQPIGQPVQAEYPQQKLFDQKPSVRKNGFAVVGLVIAIVALGICWVPIIGIIIGLVALVFSVLGIVRKNTKGRGRAIAGLIITVVSMILSVTISYCLYNIGKNFDPTMEMVNATTISSTITTYETTQSTTTITTIDETATAVVEGKYKEINPDIPLGTTYELGQGNYEVGVDIPAGRYRIERVGGNTIGGYMKDARGPYVDSLAFIDAEGSYTCILEEGVTFEISLITARFTKITSLPNDNYLQKDGSYVFESGYFFEGVDIPCGKYDITAIGGNSLGIHISTYNNSFIPLEQNETYSNLKLNHEGKELQVSLGNVKLTPK